VGGLLRFLKGQIPTIRAEYARLGPVFTVPNLAFSPSRSPSSSARGHFFKGNEPEMSQQEVYLFNVPTFGRESSSSFASYKETI
jgi:sterol 14-demethylase